MISSKVGTSMYQLGYLSQLVIRLSQVGVQNQQNLYPRIPTNDVAKATIV